MCHQGPGSGQVEGVEWAERDGVPAIDDALAFFGGGYRPLS